MNNSDYNSRLSDLSNFQPNLETAEPKLGLKNLYETGKGAIGIDTGALLKDKGVKAEAYLKTNAPNTQETKVLTTTFGAEASVKKEEYKQKLGLAGMLQQILVS